MNKMRFSIITICYNSGNTIERTIKSVLNQSYTDFEYIIKDGASKDSTMDIVRKYEPLFGGRMKWVSEPDKGVYDAMNEGVKIASGDLIGIVNSDDWLEPDALENVYKAFVENDCDLSTNYCGGINYHWNGKIKRLHVDIKSFKRQAKLYIMAGVRHPGVFVPKMVYNRVGLFDDEMKLSADQDFILRCHYSGIKFLNIGKIVSNMSDGGISTNNTSKSRQYSINDRKRMLKKFGKKGLSYYWLFYSWWIRGFCKQIATKIGLYKVS